MHFKKWYLAIVATLVFMIAGCQAGTSPTQMSESVELVSTEATTSTNTPLPTQSPTPTFTHTPEPTSTSTPTPTPTVSPVPTPVILSGLVERMCPELSPPLGLFAVHEPFYDNSTSPATLYAPFQVWGLGPNSSDEICTFYLSPPPMGEPQFGGESLFWMSFDYEAEWVMVWKYDENDVMTDDVFPQHLSLDQTKKNTSIGKAGLFDFVVDESGKTLVWSYTDPQPYDENTMGFVQMMYGVDTAGPIDQRPPVEIWFDFVPEGDMGGNIIRPRKISSDGERVFYSQEPVGLGRQWPEPLGQYSSLYSIATWGDVSPVVHFDCGTEYWCISDYSDELDILISIQGDAIQIRELSSGELLSEVQPPEAFPLVRQAMIGPDGTVAFLGVAMGAAGYGDPPEAAAIFIIEPAFKNEPVLVLADAGLLNLLGWASPSLVLVDGNNLAENPARDSTLPAHLMLVDLENGVGTWLPYDADRFVSLVH